ncbi:MAG: orotidine-5'-phosphate decarboxylase [Gemmatimonadaceae bacterium]
MSVTPIVALDVPAVDTALAIVDELGDTCRFYKIGSELFTVAGPTIVREVRARGADVFLDLKFHDIPNTVAGAVRSAVSLGARLVTVHAVGGATMIGAAAKAAGDRCGVLAVSVLTSLDETDVAVLWGRERELRITDEVLRLATIARDSGAAGLVCSGREARAIKDRFGPSFLVLIPGIRLPEGASNDQSRTSTPETAVAAGADYVVLGREVTSAPDRHAAMNEMRTRLG